MDDGTTGKSHGLSETVSVLESQSVSSAAKTKIIVSSRIARALRIVKALVQHARFITESLSINVVNLSVSGVGGGVNQKSPRLVVDQILPRLVTTFN